MKVVLAGAALVAGAARAWHCLTVGRLFQGTNDAYVQADLDVERQRLQAEQGLAQAQAEYANDYVALRKSLGLGWGQSVGPVAAGR